MKRLHLFMPLCFVGLPHLYFVLLAHLGSGTSGWPTRLGWAASFLEETSLGNPP
jgi:hypothetical protein